MDILRDAASVVDIALNNFDCKQGVTNANFLISYAVDRLVRDLRWLGHTKVMLKSDNEPAILKLLTEVLKDMRSRGEKV